MVYTATTDRIEGHNIIRHGKFVWAEEKFNFGDEAMRFAFDSLIEQAERYEYNAIVGIRHSVREATDGIYVTLIGTLVEVV